GSRSYWNGVVAVILKCEDLNVFETHELRWAPVCKNHVITGVGGENIVTEIDGQPAAKLFKRYFDVDINEMFVRNLAEFPFLVSRDGMIVARAIVNYTDNGGVVLSGAVSEGENFYLSFGDPKEIRESDRRHAKMMERFAPQGILMILCANRHIYLGKEQQREIDTFRIADVDISGGGSFGELAKLIATPRVMNYALVIVGIREGEIPPDYDKHKKKKKLRDFSSEDKYIPVLNRLSTFAQESTSEYMLLQEKEKEYEFTTQLEYERMANESKTSFLSNMSHEIRTPVNAVIGFNEMILREAEDTNIRSYAMDIKRSATTLVSLINDILDFSRIESGHLKLIEDRYSLSSLLNDVIMISSKSAADSNLKFNVEINKKMPDALLGDMVRIKQILLNILSNAVKYTNTGFVSFTADYKPYNDFEADFTYHVIDSGIGMKESEMYRLFSPFERLDEKRNRTVEGTGLGMSITQSLLTLMGSHLEVKSEYGAGSDFWFTIRQKVLSPEPIGDYSRTAREHMLSDDVHENLFVAPDAHILIVDDMPINITVTRKLLARTRVNVDSVLSGAEAVKKAETVPYDIIFMDHRMPGMDGEEAMKAIKAMTDGPNANTPIIVLTANAVSGMREKFLESGFNDYLSKPVNPVDIEKMIVRYLPEQKVLDPNDRVESETGGESGSGRKTKGFLGELERHGTFDTAYGIGMCGGLDTYLEVLQDFAGRYEDHTEAMMNAYRAGDLKDYTIRVHSLKSSARLLGVQYLAHAAEYLEGCCDRQEVMEVVVKNPSLIAMYEEAAMRIREATELFPEEAGVEKLPKIEEELELIDVATLEEAYDAVRESVEAHDFDSADNIISIIKQYRLPAGEGERFEKVKKLVSDVNRDELIKFLLRG
ncbi:MAG: response regulator, partial [Eubacterium sp.]|nr:response regulator [Eubacterium sp.]